MRERASFVISIDTEMAWGLTHRPAERYHYPNERRDLQRLLDLFDRYDIPATFAIVGHLMLDECSPVDGVKHPEIVRPEFDWLPGDWFDGDPASDADRDPNWYAPDLIDMIHAAPTDHEIATHGFSHIMAGDPGCSRATFDSELRAAVAAAADHGITLRSIIHPRNSLGHLDLLPEHGIIAYRGERPSGTSSMWQRAIDRTVGTERTAVRPIDEGPLWNLPATIMFSIESRPRTWPLWIRQVERRLDQSVRRRSMFHLWFHPHNLRDRTDETFAALERICARAASHREAGRLSTITMGSLAESLTEQAARSAPGGNSPTQSHA